MCSTPIVVPLSKSNSWWFTAVLELPTCFHTCFIWSTTYQGWVNQLSREHHLQHLKTSSSSMFHWFPVCFSSFTLGEASSWHRKRRHLGWVIHGQSAGRNGRSYQFVVVKVFFAQCHRFWCLELTTVVNGSFGSILDAVPQYGLLKYAIDWSLVQRMHPSQNTSMEMYINSEYKLAIGIIGIEEG